MKHIRKNMGLMNNQHTHQEKNSGVSAEVLRRISEGRVLMRPRWHFVLKTVLMTLSILIISIALLYVLSFVLFVSRISGGMLAPSFGVRGVGLFLLSLPKAFVLLSILFIVVLEILVRKFAFSYRRPLLYTLLLIGVFVLGGTVMVSFAGVHERVFRFAETNGVPIVGPMYKGYAGRQTKDMYPGSIVSFESDGFIMANKRGEPLRVYVSAQTRLPRGSDFAEGDEVLVVGKRTGVGVYAEGIRRFEFNRAPGRGPAWLLPTSSPIR